MLSITTDYVKSTGDPEPYLRRIAETGFTHLHWCHQWDTDFLYSKSEVDQIAVWLDELELQMLDIHASHGVEKRWASLREYERLAGIELVENRIAMAARLNSNVIILHLPRLVPEAPGGDPLWTAVRRSLDALAPFARSHGVRIALENLDPPNFVFIGQLFSEYGSDFLGLCYDAGHGNLSGIGLDQLEILKDRLISVHLHDNDGTGDHHNLLYSGTVDWARLAKIMATSSYDKCVSMELSIGRSGYTDEMAFLQKGFETGTRFAAVIAEARRAV